MVHFEPADEEAARGDTAARGDKPSRAGRPARANAVAPVAYLPSATEARNSEADPVALAQAALRRLTGQGTDTPSVDAPVTSIASKRARAPRSIPVPDIPASVDPEPVQATVDASAPDDGWAKPGEVGLSRASTGWDDTAHAVDEAAFYDNTADDETGTSAEDFDPVAEREHAEALLLGRLRSRSLSVQEATAVLGATDVSPEDIDEILAHFTELAYLDDNKLADQIIHTHHARKGLGRSGVEAEMRRRKLDPFVIIEKLDELPDEELERATELALTRVRQLSRFDDQTADRRLTAFLQRKGYSSASVRAAVKAALATRLGSGRGSTVRFQ